MTEYTLDQLIAIVRTAEPDIREMVLRMAYTLGERDQIMKLVARPAQPTDQGSPVT